MKEDKLSDQCVITRPNPPDFRRALSKKAGVTTGCSAATDPENLGQISAGHSG